MRPLSTCFALALVGASAGAARAYRLEPMSRVLATSGSEATGAFELVNRGPTRVALQLSVATLERDASYAESNRPADDDFLVHPTELILAAGARQTVRVTWVGEPELPRERAYRLVVEQLPIHLLDPSAPPPASAAGTVDLLLSYRASLFVRPAGARPAVAVAGAEPAAAEGGPRLALTLRNQGTAVANLRACKVRLAAAGREVELADTRALARTRVLAGGVRRYLLPWPAGLPVGAVVARASCETER